MANQITVNSGTGNITVTTSRSVIGTVANVASANYANFAGEANIANTAGTVTTAAQPNITSVGTLGNLTVSGTTTTQDLVVNGNLQVGNLVANSANYANFAGIAGSANAVAVANVTGIGNIATVNLDGSNSNVLYGNGTFAPVTANTAISANYANFAGNAFSVDGANVNGTVANATYADNAGNANTANSATVANSANAVAGANVSGEVAFAATANAVAGANVSGTVANATYATSAGSANTAGTVTTAAQPNITSVGTLTSLDVSGNITANVITANTLVGNIALTQVDYIDFDTANGAPSFQTGRVYWDNAKDTLAIDMNAGGNITQQVGEDQYIYIQANATITAGQVVMFNGVQGDTILGAPANTASAGFIPRYVIGIAPANIANGSNGYVQTVGEVYNLQTNAFTAGSILYLQANSNGALTATEPTAPDPKIVLAACLTQSSTPSSTNGRIQVRPDFGYYMDQLHDVSNTAATTGDVLVYNSSNVWTPSNSVPFANTASTANTANTANSATVANSANSVAGANVSGEVANANFASYANVANTANSVAVANVTGIGNIATINLDGSTSNVLYGNGVFAPVTATLSGDGGNISNINAANVVGTVSSANVATYVTVSNANSSANSLFFVPFYSANTGNLQVQVDGDPSGFKYNPATATLETGVFKGSGSSLTNIPGANVTGTVANATFATTAGTVTTAAQPNITSVGNLTSLTINANVANSTTVQTDPVGITFDGRTFLDKTEAYDDGNGTFITSKVNVLNNYGGFGAWDTTYYANTANGNLAQGGYVSFDYVDVIGNTETDPLVHSSINMSVYTNLSNLANASTQTGTSFGLGNPGLFLTVGGQTTSPVFTTIGYGDGGSGSVGMRLQRRRGDGDNRSNVAAGDYVANLEWRAAGTSTGGFNSAIPKIAPRVDAGYGGAGNTVPVGMELIVVNSSNTEVTHNFYANGVVALASNLSATNIKGTSGNVGTLIIDSNVANTTTLEASGNLIDSGFGNVFVKVDAFDDGNGPVGQTSTAKFLRGYQGFGTWEDRFYADDNSNTAYAGYTSFDYNDVIGNTSSDPLVPASYTISTYTSSSNLADVNTTTGTVLSVGNPSVQLTVGAQTGTPVINVFQYGDQGLRFNTRSGDGDNRSNVAADAYLGNIEWRGAGTSTGTFNTKPAYVTAKVDSGYGGAGNTVPTGVEIAVVNSSNTQIAHSFYANGAVNINGNIAANNLGNIASINIDGNSANVLYGNGVFATAPGGGSPTSLVNGNSNVVVNANSSVNVSTNGTANVMVVDAGAVQTTGHIAAGVSNISYGDLANTYFLAGTEAQGIHFTIPAGTAAGTLTINASNVAQNGYSRTHYVYVTNNSGNTQQVTTTGDQEDLFNALNITNGDSLSFIIYSVNQFVACKAIA